MCAAQEKHNPTPPYNPGLQRLVDAKKQWHYEPDAKARKRGFRGWHERGYLPHFDAPNVTQFVTFMLEDAFPVKRRREWEPILGEPDESEKRRKLEAWLDRGHGKCWLRVPELATAVERTLLSGDGQSYRLRSWTVMPNHVHLVVDVWQIPLAQLLKLWKGRSARDANRALCQRGRFWQTEYFDTGIRDSEHLLRAVRYTENNPTKAGLVRQAKEWQWSSARLRDEYNRLPREPDAHQESHRHASF